MNESKSHKLLRFDYLVLPFILALAFYVAFIPHQNYPYPLHIDEWVHMGYSEALLEAGSTNFTDPFSGASIDRLLPNLEAGFHIIWGVFHQISGLSWPTIFRYFPPVVFMMTVLSVYILARREGSGWEAAFFTCLIPNTVGILGPAFLVPVAIGLVFVPLSMFIAYNFRSTWAYLAIFIFTALLLSVHAPSAICLGIILAPYILLNFKDNYKHSLALTLALVIPFLAPFPWIFSLLLPTAKSLLGPQPFPTYVDIPRIIATYGYLLVLVSLLGIFVLVMRGGRREYGLVLGSLALLLVLAIFYSLHYGVSIIYERGLTFMMLMLGITAGAGLAWVKNLTLPAKFIVRVPPLLSQHIGKILCLVLVILTLILVIPERQGEPYYQMIDSRDYEAFTWITDNVGGDYETAILDPWKATAFVAITGKKVYTRIHAYPKSKDQEAHAFLSGGCTDTEFLKENGISIVYTREECNNPALEKVREDTYLLSD